MQYLNIFVWIFLVSDLELTFMGEYIAGLLPLPRSDSEDWGPRDPQLCHVHSPGGGGGAAQAQDVSALRQADRLIPGLGQDLDLVLSGQPD